MLAVFRFALKLRASVAGLVFLVLSGGRLPAAVTTVGAVPNAPPAGGGAVVGSFIIGELAFGSVTVTAGTAISSTGGATVGNGIGGIGVVSLSGFGSNWTISGATSDLFVGDEGNGQVTVSGGAVLTVPDDGLLGAQSASSGRMVVTGLGSLVDFGDDLSIGSAGAAAVEILSGGELECDVLILGDLSTAGGDVLVSGDLSRLNSTLTNVADAGRGTLQVTGGGRWQGTGDLNVGILAGSTGRVEVTGLGSLAETLGPNSLVGNVGHGTLVVRDGATFKSASTITVAATASSSGEIEVSGPGALLSVTGSITPSSGRGQITVSNGGRIVTTASSSISTTGRMTLADGVWESSAASLAAINVFGVIEGSGTLRVQGVTVAGSTPAGTLQIGAGDEMLMTGTLNNNGAAHIHAGELTVAGALTNAGLTEIQAGALTARTTMTNNGVTDLLGGGELNVGTTLANAGALNVNAGVVWVAGATTNAGLTGLISARDAILRFDGGLANSGSVTAAGGITEFSGELNNQPAGRIAVSGGATALFYDDVSNSGTISVSAAGALASTAVFFGEFSGAGVAGSGQVFLEGDARPGFSAGIMTFAGDLTFGPLARTIVEIGGVTPGMQFDRITVAGDFHRNGEFVVGLINGFVPTVGESFDVLDFDVLRTTGTFAPLTLPALPQGLDWNTSDFDTLGVLQVIPTTGLTYTQWASTVLGDPSAPQAGDHDNDAITNVQEFALGLYPDDPDTLLPLMDLHLYADGQRMRLRFTRPLDRVGVTLRIEASGDLTAWTELATSADSAPFVGPGFVSEDRAHPVNEPGLVEVRDVVNTDAGMRRFVRILVIPAD
jgi:T5SS/PEP-CTERM-associated repeat protein